MKALVSSLFQPFSAGEGFFYCIKICIYIELCCDTGMSLLNIPVCWVHTLCTPPSFRLPSARCNTPICSLDGAFSLHSTNGRKQKIRQKALLPRPSDGYRVQNKNASIVSILTFLYGKWLNDWYNAPVLYRMHPRSSAFFDAFCLWHSGQKGLKGPKWINPLKLYVLTRRMVQPSRGQISI